MSDPMWHSRTFGEVVPSSPISCQVLQAIADLGGCADTDCITGLNDSHEDEEALGVVNDGMLTDEEWSTVVDVPKIPLYVDRTRQDIRLAGPGSKRQRRLEYPSWPGDETASSVSLMRGKW